LALREPIRFFKDRANVFAFDVCQTNRTLAQRLAIFARARSAHAAEHPRKVLPRFETASYRHIQHARLSLTQHFLPTFYPVTQNELVRALARRFSN
jgi:hypothetical protein